MKVELGASGGVMEDRFKFEYIFKRKDGEMFHPIVYSIAELEIMQPLESVDKDEWELVIRRQSTGLRDKNGKLIFEGDVLLCKYGYKWTVCWSDDYHCRFNLKNNETNHTFFSIDKDYEIIGDIYRNPELLREGE